MLTKRTDRVTLEKDFTQYLLLLILWITWCALHSGLIILSFTEWLRKKYPGPFRYYRILYNLFSAATLLPVATFAYSLRSKPFITWKGPWLLIPVLLGILSACFFVAGARRYDLLQFLGIRQLKDEKACRVLTDDCSLDTRGVLTMVRHPWYTAGLLIVWARPLDLAAILTNLVLSGYFVIGTILEERKLKAQFGDQYVEYQQRVPMFFPFRKNIRNSVTR